ncbi:MAG: FAD-binding protein [Adlercreutzia equolifaciens]
MHHTMGGIRVNVESDACNADGEPIPGLYAARVHRRHPRREPLGRQRHRRLHDLRPQRRHQRRKVRPGPAALYLLPERNRKVEPSR